MKESVDRVEIAKLIDTYSEQSGQQFVLDPRVKANVRTAGIDVAKIDFATLTGILTAYGFGTVKAEDVIYVVPDVLVDELARKLAVSK